MQKKLVDYFSKCTLHWHPVLNITGIRSHVVVLYVRALVCMIPSASPLTASSCILAEQSQLKSQCVYPHMLAVPLFDSTLTASEKMPNSIMFGVYCQPRATKSSTDHKSNLIPLPEGSDPSLKSDCVLKDKPMSYFIWSNKHSG